MNKNINSILYRQIQGALKSTIEAHGPIHRKWVSSATKRIIGHLSKYNQINFPDQELKESILVLMATQHARLVLLRKKLDIIPKDRRSHLAGKTSELRAVLIALDNLLNNFGNHPKSVDEKEICQKNGNYS